MLASSKTTERKKKRAQQRKWERSLLSAAAAFAYEFQQLQQFSVTFVIFFALFSGARERLLETFRPVDCTQNTQHTKHITHSYSQSLTEESKDVDVDVDASLDWHLNYGLAVL